MFSFDIFITEHPIFEVGKAGEGKEGENGLFYCGGWRLGGLSVIAAWC